MKSIIVAALVGAVYGVKVEAEAEAAMYPFAMGQMPAFGQYQMGIPSPYPTTHAPFAQSELHGYNNMPFPQPSYYGGFGGQGFYQSTNPYAVVQTFGGFPGMMTPNMTPASPMPTTKPASPKPASTTSASTTPASTKPASTKPTSTTPMFGHHHHSHHGHHHGHHGHHHHGHHDTMTSPDMASPDMTSDDMTSPDMTSTDMMSTDMTSTDMTSSDMTSPDNMTSPDMMSSEMMSHAPTYFGLPYDENPTPGYHHHNKPDHKHGNIESEI